MIAIKGGTQTWSTAKQESSLKGDKVQTMSATERDQVLGKDEDLGAHLNKIADPNWVDPSKMRKVGGDELGKDAFMKLLLTQLKNQDPTTPLKSHEMAAQLAQFTSLEKLQGIQDNLGVMAKNKDGAGQFDTLNLIGKAIKGDSTEIVRNDSTEEHDINFNLLGDAQDVELTIKDAAGNVVKVLEVKDLKKGSNKITWNGINDEGAAMGTGSYRVEIEANAVNGKKIGAETKFAGVITGVNFGADGPILLMGKQKIRMKDVRTIMNASEVAQVNKAKVLNNAQKVGAQVVQNVGNQLDQSVAMSREMMNKVSKELDSK